MDSIVGQKSKKWPEMTRNYVCASTPYLSKHRSYDRVFLLHKFKNVFSIFFKFWFCGLLGGRGLKRQKMAQNDKKILPHFVSQELYLIWLSFLVHMGKMISPANFFIFSKSDFSGFSKFINKRQKEILRCAPPFSHVCDFFVKLWLILS